MAKTEGKVKKQKSPKGGGKKRQNDLYKLHNRRYLNSVAKIKLHMKKYPEDHKAKKWLEFLLAMPVADYQRGKPELEKKWGSLFGKK